MRPILSSQKIKLPSSRTDTDDTSHRVWAPLPGTFFEAAPVANGRVDNQFRTRGITREIKTPLEKSALMFYAINQITMIS